MMKALMSASIAMLAGVAGRDVVRSPEISPLCGTWTLVAADKLLPDGQRARDYGQAPHGRLIVDARGRYSLQIFKTERVRFGGDKAEGTADEFASAALGSSTHYGTVEVDVARHALIFRIEGSSFPNWEGTVQKRSFQLEKDVLSYNVPARPDGSIPISEWRRLE